MYIISKLERQNVKVTEIPKWGSYLRKTWENRFAASMELPERDAILVSHFLWHLFSYGMKPCFTGGQADQAFSEQPKRDCFLFYQHTDDAYILEHAEQLIAADLKGEEDAYITDKHMTWTYAVTHESAYGPYFAIQLDEKEHEPI
ncbi:DUF4275 family protein [Bacillus licheniformis]|jgi:hypothetical protein|uniref:DUF4275 family protein n=2 Tax=Bacillus licheniformis TaxID=1402 RepID=Q65D20_BACLD|nr:MULTISPECIES: DUF4275 family protein [Bacillus]MBY8348569.1 DUF4275 family protein [Bacillus sp. PCH94]MDP4166924.1 DUF4275 family protein [Bacillota bacterium]AAU25665.1 hypothetical protein BL00231 [Bacillus licheniformis DSM 13 = ATCC 14580]AAU43044.1 hypothetical protein BLi04231 [Bacillus licheniformis DSM 13 = ATCC 14580]APJ29040.1 hypothetical protein BSZ43_20815 [Bacillus sp. H15-1]